jgi:hypothetical protein
MFSSRIGSQLRSLRLKRGFYEVGLVPLGSLFDSSKTPKDGSFELSDRLSVE